MNNDLNYQSKHYTLKILKYSLHKYLHCTVLSKYIQNNILYETLEHISVITYQIIMRVMLLDTWCGNPLKQLT